ncbi:Maf family protein [Neptunicella marina]|uniref:7-methyl-GTP pyrophosphatase n=1 Tax=Neptunicella marina TaxID=2125989 RepID=A0A8J6J1J6_9ALTE|nr:nucleoside triphosphate pyrophosphatase [Neptunicella marina]MBC3767853.1 septum formation inhibitor Maf [Neptunicella marina]
MKIVLASTSPFRASVLKKLCIPFEQAAPHTDETAHENESAEQLVERLAIAKAKALSCDDAWIIGSDQVATVDGKILGKPHTHEKAVEQLSLCSGKTVRFLTGLCLHNAKADVTESLVEPFDVNFKVLNENQIERYLRAEQPYNCAGSFKSEGLGICLFESLQGRDPNTLIGLPLIALIDLFRLHNIELLEHISL